VSTKGNPGMFDGMQRAQDGEPVFTLRAHDPLAAPLVKEWVRLRRVEIQRAHGAGEITDEKRALELAQCRDAEEIAFNMDTWREGEAQVVNAPKAATKGYTGMVRAADELEAERLWQARKRLHKEACNAVAEVNEACEALAKWGFGTARTLAAEGVDKLRAAAEVVNPEHGYSVADLSREWL
jgi:uncharacterized protein YbaA (DUF1428 family)